MIAEYGKLELELDADVAPITVTNFVNLAKKGFYNGLTFHRIMSGFMIQGGDPNGDYAAYGKVTAGMDIVDKICQSVQPIDNNGTVPADQQPKITAIKVID